LDHVFLIIYINYYSCYDKKKWSIIESKFLILTNIYFWIDSSSFDWRHELSLELMDKSRNTRVNGQQQQQENWNDHEIAICLMT